MNNTGKIMTAVAAGAAIGYVLGVLFAPDKGSETRRKIAERSKKLAVNVKGKLHAGKEKMENLKEGLRDAVTDITEKFA